MSWSAWNKMELKELEREVNKRRMRIFRLATDIRETGSKTRLRNLINQLDVTEARLENIKTSPVYQKDDADD